MKRKNYQVLDLFNIIMEFNYFRLNIPSVNGGNVTSVMALRAEKGNNAEEHGRARRKRRHVWRELDITDLVTEARGADWR